MSNLNFDNKPLGAKSRIYGREIKFIGASLNNRVDTFAAEIELATASSNRHDFLKLDEIGPLSSTMISS